MIVASASRAFQAALESGSFKGTLASAASRVWGNVAARRLVKELIVPDHVRVIAVGGSTLGGSGKTPVAIAWARREAESGAHVALIGHAYRANPKHARVVSADSNVRDVGDEALVCARALKNVADVIVAPSRQMAADFAVRRGARALVLDGVSQISPRRADVALLVMNSENAALACPPAGDLRAPLSILKSLSDFVVVVADEKNPPTRNRDVAANEIAAQAVCDHVVSADGDVVSFEAVSKMRVGVALSIAHPERMLEMLARRAVVPVVRSYVGDHAGAELRRSMALASDRVSHRDGSIDAWLISDKCAAFVVPTSHDTIPIYVVAHAITLHGGGTTS